MECKHQTNFVLPNFVCKPFKMETFLKDENTFEAKETPKDTPKEKDAGSKNGNGKDVQVINSSGSENEAEKETRVAGTNMNQTMTKLYSTPSKPATDFEKIKNAAKVAEKNIGKLFLAY